MNKISKKIKEFIGKIRPANLNMKKQEESIKIVIWHFSKEGKWFAIFLKVEYFLDLHMMI